MEVRVGVVLLNFSFLFLLSTEKKAASKEKKYEKLACFSAFLSSAEFSMEIQWTIWKGEAAAMGATMERKKEKIQMWIKLCYLVRIE